MAALLLDLRPNLSPAQIYEILEDTAVDIGAPAFDNDSGFGLIQADAALKGDFVRQQYLDFLDREPDSEELSFRVSQLNGGLPRGSQIAAIMDSSEFSA